MLKDTNQDFQYLRQTLTKNFHNKVKFMDRVTSIEVFLILRKCKKTN